MLRKALLISVLAFAVLAAGALAPRRAAAVEDLAYIIPAGIAGAAAVVVLVAILFADREDPEFMPLVPEPAGPGSRTDGGTLGYGVQCRPEGGNFTLLCW